MSKGAEFRRCARKDAKMEVVVEVASALTAAGTQGPNNLQLKIRVCKALLTLVGTDPSQAKLR